MATAVLFGHPVLISKERNLVLTIELYISLRDGNLCIVYSISHVT